MKAQYRHIKMKILLVLKNLSIKFQKVVVQWIEFIMHLARDEWIIFINYCFPISFEMDGIKSGIE